MDANQDLNAPTPPQPAAPVAAPQKGSSALRYVAVIVIAVVIIALVYLDLPSFKGVSSSTTMPSSTTVTASVPPTTTMTAQSTGVKYYNNPNLITVTVPPAQPNATASCPGGEIFNSYLSKCQANVTVPSAVIFNAVDSYLSRNGYGSCPITTADSYYGANSSEIAIADCSGNSTFTDAFVFFFNSSGRVMNVTQSD